jgi:hypothetical protein
VREEALYCIDIDIDIDSDIDIDIDSDSDIDIDAVAVHLTSLSTHTTLHCLFFCFSVSGLCKAYFGVSAAVLATVSGWLFVSVGRRASLVCGTPAQPSVVSVPAAIYLHATRLFAS